MVDDTGYLSLPHHRRTGFHHVRASVTPVVCDHQFFPQRGCIPSDREAPREHRLFCRVCHREIVLYGAPLGGQPPYRESDILDVILR